MSPWQFIVEKEAKGIETALLYVLESVGSSPGRQGFHMALSRDGDLCGSIGGGIMEHKFVELARSGFLQEKREGIFRQVHDKRAGEQHSGMICSGEQTIFLHYTLPGDMPAVTAIAEDLSLFRQGTLRISNNGISYFHSADPNTPFSFLKGSGDDFIYLERTGLKNIIHVIGGGHCSLAFCKLMREMDFYIHVYDDRTDLNTMESNVFAHERHILRSYGELQDKIHDGENVYAVIMTFGYRSDDIAVRAILDKKIKYLGLLGSANKIKKMFAAFEEGGIETAKLARIHSPVGIHIHSQTPAEIAVSIAAQIIQVKNQ